MTPRIAWAGLTHTGLRRDHNEDSFFVDETLGVGFVADGMGGHDFGEVASALAVATVHQALRDGATLTHALQLAHEKIQGQHDAQGPRARRMGTTAVLLRIQGATAQVAWVGDSRAYLFDTAQGLLSPLTKDHTVVQELLDQKLITAAQARTHPLRNKIRQSLGLGARGLSRPDPGTASAHAASGNLFLLCSDGLTEHVSDDQIQTILNGDTRNLETVAQRLLKAALDDGGSDNVTVVLGKVERS